MKDKTESYIGFAMKKGSVIYGVDNIVEALDHARSNRKNRAYIVLATETLSDSSRKRLTDALDKTMQKSEDGNALDTPRLFTIEDYDLLRQKNCKALAITDYELAKAVWKNLYMPREEK